MDFNTFSFHTFIHVSRCAFPSAKKTLTFSSPNIVFAQCAKNTYENPIDFNDSYFYKIHLKKSFVFALRIILFERSLDFLVARQAFR